MEDLALILELAKMLPGFDTSTLIEPNLQPHGSRLFLTSPPCQKVACLQGQSTSIREIPEIFSPEILIVFPLLHLPGKCSKGIYHRKGSKQKKKKVLITSLHIAQGF